MALKTLFLLPHRVRDGAALAERLEAGDGLLLLEEGVYNRALTVPQGVACWALEADCEVRGLNASPFTALSDADFVSKVAQAARVVTLSRSLVD